MHKNFYAVEHPRGYSEYQSALKSDPNGDLAGAKLFTFPTRQRRDSWVKVRGGVARMNENHWRQTVIKDHPLVRRMYRENSRRALLQEN